MAAYVCKAHCLGPHGEDFILYADTIPELHAACAGVLSRARYHKSPPWVVPHYLLSKRQAGRCRQENGAVDGQDNEHAEEMNECRRWWRRATAKRLIEKRRSKVELNPRNKKTKKLSTATFNKNLKYRKRKGLCIRCGRKPCVCK